MCEDLHEPQGNKLNSAKRKKLLIMLQLELERTRCVGDYEICQMRMNIKKSMNNAQTASLQSWLDTIQNVKEREIMLRQEK